MAIGASIQIEDGGFLKIHNLIFEALATAPLRGQQFRCLMFLFRQTYGYNKKEERISLAEWEKGTGMKRQNVWRELQILIAHNVIYKKSNGPKRANTWGFNKYCEQWQFDSVITDDDKSVITTDYTTVITDDYREEPSVIASDDKSVITPHERKSKDNKKQQSLLAASEEETKRVNRDEDADDAMALMREAYNTVCRIAPSQHTDDGRANLITASELIEVFGFKECLRGLATLKERNDAMIRKNVRNAIRAPIPYLRTIMEGEHEAKSSPASSVLDFVVEEVYA